MSSAVRVSDSLVKYAKTVSKVENRSVAGQIEYWAQIGKIAEENPDMPYSLIKDILKGLAEADSNMVTEYEFD